MLRDPGQVLLVSCYELGHQPHALAMAAGFLARAGFAPAALDVAVDGLDEARLCRARVVCISVPMHTALRLGLRLADWLRARRPDTTVVFFGLYALLNAERLLAGPADHVLGGESEGNLVRLLEALDRGERPAAAKAGSLDRLDFPVPAREGLPPLARYAPLLDHDGPRTAGYVEASRGCLHRCRHCPIVPVYDGRLFVVPAEVVLADVRRQVAEGAGHVTFGDPDFLNAPGHVLPIVRALHAEHPRLSFDVTVKVEHVLRHHRLFPELRALGCAFVVSAVESLEDEVLLRLDKGHTGADVGRALAVLDAAALPMRPTLVPFTPWSTLGGYLALLEWIEANDLASSVDPIQLAIRLLVPPGSRLLEIPPTPGWPGPLDADALTHRWTHVDPRLDELQSAVAARVEEAARRDEDAVGTLASVYELALAAAGESAPRPSAPLSGPRRDRPPRLAEAWFC